MSKKRDIPVFGQPIIETHCHLDYLKAAALDDILQRAHEVGVESIITIAVSPGNLDTVLQIARAHNNVFCSQGIHPHEADHFSAAVLQRIRSNAHDERVVAIGECGLDYYYDQSDRQRQRDAFAAQLALACELDLPVIVHTRDADDDTRAMLAEYAPALQKKGVIHSFTAGEPLAEFCLDAGFSLGFNGICTFNKADNVRAIVALCPLQQLLLETDAPYLTPVPWRGHENAPCYLPFVAEKIAEVKNVEVSTVLTSAYDNSRRLFTRLGCTEV